MSDGPEDIIERMARLKAEGQPFALATVVRTLPATSAKVGAKAIIGADGTTAGWVGGGCVEGVVRKAATQALADGEARLVRVQPAEADPRDDGADEYKSICPSGGTAEVFIEPVLPRPSLIVAGESQTARALADLGERLGYNVVALTGDLSAVPGAATGAVVVATQGKRDREALEAALATGAPYVGFVGSRRKAAKLKQEMIDRGVAPERVAALRSPAGLDIGAGTPEEIALSILAEIVQTRRGSRPADPVEAPDDAETDALVTIAGRASGTCCGDD